MGSATIGFIFLIPAVIAYLGLNWRLKPLTVAAGVLWLTLCIWFFAASTGTTDLYYIFAWLSMALGIAFALSPLWIPGMLKLKDTNESKLAEKRATMELAAIKAAEEREPSYGERQEKWEQDSGLRTGSQRRERKARTARPSDIG